MGAHSRSKHGVGSIGSKREARVALVKRVRPLGLTLVLILRGVKGLEKVYVLEHEEEVSNIMKQFSAVALEVDRLDQENLSKLPEQLREVVASFRDLLERLSSEIASIVG